MYKAGGRARTAAGIETASTAAAVDARESAEKSDQQPLQGAVSRSIRDDPARVAKPTPEGTAPAAGRTTLLYAGCLPGSESRSGRWPRLRNSAVLRIRSAGPAVGSDGRVSSRGHRQARKNIVKKVCATKWQSARRTLPMVRTVGPTTLPQELHKACIAAGAPQALRDVVKFSSSRYRAVCCARLRRAALRVVRGKGRLYTV
jgi:hypothetical protein